MTGLISREIAQVYLSGDLGVNSPGTLSKRRCSAVKLQAGGGDVGIELLADGHDGNAYQAPAVEPGLQVFRLEALEGQVDLPPLGGGVEGRAEVLPGAHGLRRAQMNMVSVAVAADPGPDTFESRCIQGTAALEQRQRDLDEAAVVFQGNPPAQAQAAAPSYGLKARYAIGDPAHDPVGEKPPLGAKRGDPSGRGKVVDQQSRLRLHGRLPRLGTEDGICGSIHQGQPGDHRQQQARHGSYPLGCHGGHGIRTTVVPQPGDRASGRVLVNAGRKTGVQKRTLCATYSICRTFAKPWVC